MCIFLLHIAAAAEKCFCFAKDDAEVGSEARRLSTLGMPRFLFGFVGDFLFRVRRARMNMCRKVHVHIAPL